MSARRFWWLLAAIAALALTVRVGYIVGERTDYQPGGDPFYYHEGSQLLADGEGFIAPHIFAESGEVVQAADHPPLYLLWLTIPSAAGGTSPITHMLWSALLGTASVAVIGLLGREVAGDRVGLIAAGLAAVYPNIWGHDGMIHAETMAIFTGSLAVLLGYRYWRDPTSRRLVVLGVACAFAALSRTELLLLLPAMVLPLVLVTRVDLRARAAALAVAGLAATVPLAPWIGFNLARFDQTVLLSSGFEITLATANCERTWYGNFTGYWWLGCADMYARESGVPGANAATNADAYRSGALSFIGDNLSRLPVVLAARVGRVTGLYRPLQQVNLDTIPEGRDPWVAKLSLAMYYPIALLAVAGGVVLRRRPTPLFPLLALPLTVLVTVLATFGQNRYRAIAEGALVVLAAIAVDAAIRAVRAPDRAVTTSTRSENDP